MPDPADSQPPNVYVVVPDRAAFVTRVDEALQGTRAEDRRRLWVTVHSFPSLSLLEASFPPEVMEDAMREIEAHLRREYPEILAMSRLQNDEIACASLGPSEPLSLRGASARKRRFALERITVRGEPLFLSVRSGSSAYEDGIDATELLRRAHVAHVTAGVRGQDDTQTYDHAMDRVVEAEARLLGELVQAIERNELELVYQPQVDLASGRLVGAEALVRWSGDDGQPVPPGRLIAAAERAGSVVPLGGWVLRAACRQAARWRADGLPPFHVAVNVSPIQLYRTDLVRSVTEALAAHDLPASWLELEITESGAMAGGDEAVETANTLRELGVALALDDFGTGTSSLSRLRELPLTRLKIDQSFVRHCPPKVEGRCLIRAIAAMGHSFGLRTLAEGVETAEQLAYVTEAGCDEAQGFHFAAGLGPDALAAFAKARGVGAS